MGIVEMLLQWVLDGVGKELAQALVTAVAVGAGYWSSQWKMARRKRKRYQSAVSTMSLLHSRIRDIAKKIDADAARIVVTHNSGRPLADSLVWKSSAYCVWCKDSGEDLVPDVWAEHALDPHYLQTVLVPLTTTQPVLQVYQVDLPVGCHLRMVYEAASIAKSLIVLIKSEAEIVYVSFGFSNEDRATAYQMAMCLQSHDELSRILGDG